NGIVSKDDLKLTSGTYSINSSGNALEANDIIAIANGVYNLNSQNDALHSDNDITVVDGTISIKAKDDAFHADNILTVSGGKINVEEAHEGLEGKEIYISGGDISVITDDDGVNAAGGNDSSGIQNGGFKDEFSSQDGVLISISGGKLYVNCEGDGLDSNGDLEITGGEIIVEGPQNSGNGSLDYNGSASIKNATLLAIGSSGMAMNFSEAGQGSALVNFGASYSEEKITVSDSDGNEIFSFNSTKTISSVLFSASSLEKGKTYTISIGDEYQTITLNDYIYGSSNGFGMGNMR
ncbi:MAG: carbohydrate-binding domain-containing protein, partial [Eubacterium sp.]|nr:carbohydrate-binding domain-containing protein [Eubacterium sp.]